MADEDVEGAGGAFEAVDVFADPPSGPARGLGAAETVEGVGGLDFRGVAAVDLGEEGAVLPRVVVARTSWSMAISARADFGEEGVGDVEDSHGVGL